MDCYIEYQNNVNKKYRVGNTRYWFFLRLNHLEDEIYTYPQSFAGGAIYIPEGASSRRKYISIALRGEGPRAI